MPKEMARNEIPATSTANTGEPEMTKAENLKVVPETQDTAPETSSNSSISVEPKVKVSQTSKVEALSSVAVPDPELSSLCLPTDYVNVGLEKSLDKVPVGRRDDQEWIRIHPDPAYTRDVPLINYKVKDQKGNSSDKDFHLVRPCEPVWWASTSLLGCT
jgi:hypothetical protein